MQIFNIGPVELILIILIMFILLGPEGMIKTARQIGTWIRNLIKSPIWRDIMGYSREIRDLPTKMVRETGLDEDLKEIQKTTQELNSDIKGTITEANKEVEQSLKEAGSVDVRLDTKPPAASRPYPATVPPPARQTNTSTVQTSGAPVENKVDESPAPAPPVQTYHKYTTDEDEEEDE
jgi:sec-independent protein translocase protein TatB